MSETDQLAEPVGYAPASQAATATRTFEIPLADLSFADSLARVRGWRERRMMPEPVAEEKFETRLQGMGKEIHVSEFVKNIGIPLNLPEDFDYKEEVRKYLEEKYK